MAKKLTRLKINEVSSVDRGAGEGVKVMLLKREARKQAEIEGEPATARPEETDATEAELTGKMWRDFMRKQSIEGTDSYVEEQAEAHEYESGSGKSNLSEAERDDPQPDYLGMQASKRSSMSKFADYIKRATNALTASVVSIQKDDTVKDKPAMLAKTVQQFGAHLAKTNAMGDATIGSAQAAEAAEYESGSGRSNEPLEDESTDKRQGDARKGALMKTIAKMLGLAEDASEQDITKALEQHNYELAKAKAKVTDDEEKFADKEKDSDKKKRFFAASHEQRAEIMKAATQLPEGVRKQLEEAEDMKKRLAKLEEERDLALLEKRAIEVGLPSADAVTLHKAYQGDREAVDKLVGFVKQGLSAAKAAGAFSTFGGGGGNAPLTAFDELTAKAAELRKVDPKLTQQQVFAKVYADPANLDVVKRERAENRPSAH